MAVFCAATTVIYVVTRVEPAPVVQWLLMVGPALMVILWICQDARQRQVVAVTDLDFFLCMFWPVAIPWYAFKSRGGSGWKLLLGLLAMVFVTPLTLLLLLLLRFS